MLTSAIRPDNQSYPYPAFVLVVPIPPPREFDDTDDIPGTQDQQLAFSRSSTSHTNPFTPIWANEKWKNLLHGTDLLQSLDMHGARRFGDWISGARAAKKDRRDSSTSAALETFIGQGGSTSRKRAIQAMSDRARAAPTLHAETVPPGFPEAPEGFWEPEMPPYEDRSTKSDLASSSDDATGIGAVEDDHPGPNTITVQLKKPGKVTLEMTKSMMPIYSKAKNGAMTKVITHTFAIITTTPRSALVMDTVPQRTNVEIPTIAMSEPDSDGVARPPRKTVLPNPSSPVRGLLKKLPTATNLDVPPLESDDLDTPTDEKTQHVALGTPARPMIFQKDGSVKRQQSAFPEGAMDNGKSLDVHVLLKTTDWSKTGLGPMDSWPQSLKSAGKFIHGL
jgi:hypothetical protein